MKVHYTGICLRKPEEKIMDYYCWLFGRYYTFNDHKEGKAFYEYWKRH